MAVQKMAMLIVRTAMCHHFPRHQGVRQAAPLAGVSR